MRIERIYIDGYGVFRDFPLDGLSPALTVIFGRNESGKTTLLSFIRTILFGFLTKAGDENVYEPLHGGRHGGRIFLVDSRNERFVVERFAGPRGGLVTLTLPDGSEGSAADLASLLGHASRDLFRNVFAFSLTELQTFATLRSEDIRARIYGAGIGAGRLSLPEIAKRTEEDRGKLFRERGSTQDIAVLIREADAVRDKLREIARYVPDYDRLRKELERLNREGEAKRRERDRKLAELGHIRNLSSAWEDWVELQSAEQETRQLPEVTEFPSEGVTRLEGLLHLHRERQERLEELQRQVVRHQEELASTQLNDPVLAQGTEIESLQRGLDKYESAREDLPKREPELETELQRLREGLRDLGRGWDEERVKAFDTSLPIREAVRGDGEALKASSERLHDAERDARNATGALAEARAVHQRREDEWRALEEPSERNRKTLEEKRRKLRSLRSLLSSCRTNTQRRDHLEERRDDLQARCASVERQLSQEAISLPLWPAILGSAMALGVGVWLVLQRDWIPAVVMALIAVTVGVGYLRVRGRLDFRAQKESLEGELRSLRSQLEDISAEATAVGSRAEAEKNSIGALAQEVGFGSIPDERDIDGADSDVEKALEILNTWQTAQKRVQEAAQLVEDQERCVQAAQEEEKQAREQVQQAAERWHAWLQNRRLDPTMRPDTCLELLSRVETLRERIDSVHNLRKRIHQIVGAVDGYEERANTIRMACNLPKRSRSAFPGAVDELVEILRTAREDANRHEGLRRAIEEAKDETKILQGRAQEVENEIEGLLAEGGAADEEEFRKRAEVFEKRQKLAVAIGSCKKNLERIAGRGKALDAFERELERTNPEELQRMESELIEQSEELEADLRGTLEESGRVGEQIRGLETEEESADLRLRLSTVQEQLRSKARQWSVLTIAQALLAETRLKYERERQPAVVQEAQRFFFGFTEGRYPRILSLPGENRIEVEERTGARKDTSKLSRGTTEQLYLALRFGLVREFSRRSEPLPVIMDEILVNFDDYRAPQACTALGELSKVQQVLVFTCHSGTVELLRSEIPHCSVIELPPELA